jgi:hypothetical protein
MATPICLERKWSASEFFFCLLFASCCFFEEPNCTWKKYTLHICVNFERSRVAFVDLFSLYLDWECDVLVCVCVCVCVRACVRVCVCVCVRRGGGSPFLSPIFFCVCYFFCNIYITVFNTANTYLALLVYSVRTMRHFQWLNDRFYKDSDWLSHDWWRLYIICSVIVYPFRRCIKICIHVLCYCGGDIVMMCWRVCWRSSR